MARIAILLGAIVVCCGVSAENILDEIGKRPNLSQMLAIINSDRLLPAQMATQGFTAFIPTNEAMEKFEGIKDQRLIRYHIANIPYTVQDLPDELNTELPGNPRLYITKIPSGNAPITGWEHQKYYINNAMVTSANHLAHADDGVTQQYLHIIDQVIEPTVTHVQPNGSVATFLNPDAQRLLEKPRVYGIVDRYSISEFDKRVRELGVEDVFAMKGKNTFFIPVDSALNPNATHKDMIDKQVVHGHVVPNRVLFTRTVTSSSNQYESLAFTDNLKVFITMENVTVAEGEEMAYYVKSNTIASDVSHKKGTVLARIIKGNVPVRNGVVHFIDRSLMVVTSSIMLYLQEKDGQLSKFYQLMKEHYPELTYKLVSQDEHTLFAPSNEAFNMVNKKRLNEVILNSERLARLLNLHVINRRLTTDEIVDHSTREIFQVETLSSRRKLYFAVNKPSPDPHFPPSSPSSSASSSSSSLMPVVTLEGAGVNATITTANIATKNGVIHIIDRILGIPSQTVYEKLGSDPMLSSSFSLSEQKEWNKRLLHRDEKFTLFVPSNEAWDYIKRTMPSAHKKLFMGEFSYHVRYILERHMIVGEAFSLEELAALTTNSSIRGGFQHERLQMTRGKIYFQAKVKHSFGASEYYVEWNGIRAKVIRPDVECVNGIVHVIDGVLMVNRDVTVSGSNAGPSTNVFLVLVLALGIVMGRE